MLTEFNTWIEEVQLPHFGTAHTRNALIAAGAYVTSHGNADWVVRARKQAQQATWYSCPHAAVSSQGVVAWIAADLQINDQHITEEGHIYTVDNSEPHSILVERMLEPLFLHVERSGHAERRALIGLLRMVVSTFHQTKFDGWEVISGVVELYVTHFPCVSCLVAIAQFTRRLPRVQVWVEFDNAWIQWKERSNENLPLGILSVGSV